MAVSWVSLVQNLLICQVLYLGSSTAERNGKIGNAYVTQVRSVHQRSLNVRIFHVVRELALRVLGVWAAIPVHGANNNLLN